jgi:hypothetical protein
MGNIGSHVDITSGAEVTSTIQQKLRQRRKALFALAVSGVFRE